MEFLSEFGFVGIISFGSVAILGYFLARYQPKFTFGSSEKLIALVLFAFAYGFVPAEFGNAIAERAKDAIYIATALTALYVGTKKIAGKVGGE